MSRVIESINCTIDVFKDIPNPQTSLDENVASGQFSYLLAHADDGVIWGKIENKTLALSSDAYPDVSPKLRMETLRELRLFGKDAEWFLWRFEDGWRARLIKDGKGPQMDVFTESYLLWGTDSVGAAKTPFTLVQEADTGIRHAPPLVLKGRHSLHLLMRHYLEDDQAGVVLIKLSRLVDLKTGGKND